MADIKMRLSESFENGKGFASKLKCINLSDFQSRYDLFHSSKKWQVILLRLLSEYAGYTMTTGTYLQYTSKQNIHFWDTNAYMEDFPMEKIRLPNPPEMVKRTNVAKAAEGVTIESSP